MLPIIRLLVLFAKISAIATDIKANIIDITTNRIADSSVPGICVAVYNANGRVCVSPGIFDTNVIVAPNSARHLANARVIPVIIDGNIWGNVIEKKQSNLLAPLIYAASSVLWSNVSNPNLIDLTSKGKDTTAAAIAATFQEKFTEISNRFLSH